MAALSYPGVWPRPALAEDLPGTLYWDAGRLLSLRSNPTEVENPAAIERALEQLAAEAAEARRRGPYSVMQKSLDPPSGNKHDYLSYSRYWWPNPDTADGLPYVRRDGVVNRQLLAQGDRLAIGALCNDVETLALAAYLLNSPRDAEQAVKLLKTWFLESNSRMTPHLRYGQAVPGRAEGRGVGILDTRHFIRVLESVALLEACGALAMDDTIALQQWFAKYLDWLLTSDLGADERNATNNHGVWYAAQTARIALFVDQREVAASILRDTRDDRLPTSVLPDGRQPRELQRTRSLHYSLFSLEAYGMLARLGESLGVDLWQADAEPKGRLRSAIDFVTPFVDEPERWQHQQIAPFVLPDRQKAIFLLAAERYSEPAYLQVLGTTPSSRDSRNGNAASPTITHQTDRVMLLFTVSLSVR